MTSLGTWKLSDISYFHTLKSFYTVQSLIGDNSYIKMEKQQEKFVVVDKVDKETLNPMEKEILAY